MKYHYQFVSKTTVRIELIPEDKKEKELLSTFSKEELDDPQLTELYQKGLQGYATGTSLIRTNFMSFPNVALCSYVTQAKLIA